MRLLQTVFIILLFSLSIQAQIVESPLMNNPVLQQLAFEKEQARTAKIQAFQERFHIESSLLRDTETKDVMYVLSGESITFCQDTIQDTFGGGSFELINCGSLDFGVATLDSNCLTYTADSGFDLEEDLVCVEFCRTTGDCDTIQFPIVIKRANTSKTLSLIELEAEEEAIVSVEIDTLALPGNWSYMEILGDTLCSEYEDFGTMVSSAGLTILYESSAFSESDEVCVVLCDDATVCDTVKIPFLVRQDTLQLPFFDDFSYAGPYPNRNNWLTDDVFVNNTLGFQPPSVGVATFDGLDDGGSPHQMGVNLPSDVLTSGYIDLSGTSQAFLSFYIQPKGNADKPEVQDSLILEFKNNQEQWIQIAAFEGLENNVPNDSIPPFAYQSISAEFTPAFLHEGFQFRFWNKSSGIGAIDNWHLDYVLLNDMNQTSVFEDVAFTQIPNDILHPYSSMPWNHFEGNAAAELDQFIEVGVYNNSDETANAAASKAILREKTSSTTIYDATLFSNDIVANIPVATHRTNIFDLNTSEVNPPFPNVWTGQNYLSQMEDFSGDDLEFELEYLLVSDENTAIMAAVNDTVRKTTIFDNYFAYDDGTAESNISAQGPGTQIALKFHSNTADSIKAIQVYIPRINANAGLQEFSLKVWIGELDDSPDYVLANQTPLYADLVADTIQGYTTYRFQDAAGTLQAVALPAGDFYIGWEQVSNNFSTAIPIGVDKNNLPATDFAWGNLGSTWEPITDISSLFQGAIMIRPVVGQGTPPNTNVEALANTPAPFSIYPNPSNGQFFVRLDKGNYSNFEVEIFNSTGQLIKRERLSPELDLQSFTEGIYFAKIRNVTSNRIFHERMIVVK